MRIWADVYNTLDVKQGTVYTVVNPTIVKALDDIGSLTFSTPATDPDALTLLVNEARVRLFIEHDGVSRELGRGVIRKVTATMNASGYTLNFDCVGSMDALNRKNVLLGRSYTNQPIATIAAALTALVSGWSVGVDAGLGNQTARFDGVSVFKALLTIASEKGLHVREGTAANTLELGAYGTASGVFAVAPGHNNIELEGNDNLVLIESIVQETDGRDITNWVVPIGAGEGSAALTLKNATATSYPILTMLAPDGSTLYYLTDTTSVTTYGQIEKIILFKDIGPIANSDTAKAYAANALYDAAVAQLLRNKDPLVTYRVNVRKPRVTLRPGDKITLTYKGYVQTDNAGGTLVPISVENQQFWIMKITERVTDSGDVLELTISSIDRYKQDMTKIVVDAIESMNARNIGVQTYPSTFIYVYSDTIGWNGGSKPGSFRLKIKDYVTDIISIRLSFRTFPLDAPVIWQNTAPPSYNWALKASYNYPSDITITIDGTDRSTALGAPSGAWNFGGTNAALDIPDLDITQYILTAAGGIYQTHTIVFDAGTRTAEVRYDSSFPSATQSTASAGRIEVTIEVLCTVRATAPAPT